MEVVLGSNGANSSPVMYTPSLYPNSQQQLLQQEPPLYYEIAPVSASVATRLYPMLDEEPVLDEKPCIEGTGSPTAIQVPSDINLNRVRVYSRYAQFVCIVETCVFYKNSCET